MTVVAGLIAPAEPNYDQPVRSVQCRMRGAPPGGAPGGPDWSAWEYVPVIDAWVEAALALGTVTVEAPNGSKQQWRRE